MYSPEYLAKNMGLKLMMHNLKKIGRQEKGGNSFGFYNSLILFIFLAISLSRLLYFFQDFVITQIPSSEFYLNYFFESIRNTFEFWRNLVTY